MEKKIRKDKTGGAKQVKEDIANAMEEERTKILGPKPTCFDTLPFQVRNLMNF